MSLIATNITKLKQSLPGEVTLVAVSKTKPVSDLQEAYDAGQRIFGENKIQEMTDKHAELPKDIEWHMIGHVQTNKVKYMAPYVHLIHAVDSFKLLSEINKQAAKHNRTIHCLLQLKIASEESKFGLSAEALEQLISSEQIASLENIKISGLMGMASFSSNNEQVANEFKLLKQTFDNLQKPSKSNNCDLQIISMGMSGDYPIALECGSNMIRVGSAIFGNRNYNN